MHYARMQTDVIELPLVNKCMKITEWLVLPVLDKLYNLMNLWISTNATVNAATSAKHIMTKTEKNPKAIGCKMDGMPHPLPYV